mgnify:CR=1 FL=1
MSWASTQFVEQQLHSLNVTKATGIDNINVKYLNNSASIIAPILTHRCKCSVRSFKTAKVTPIFKKGDTREQSNNRPTSVLPVMSLILERHVSTYLKVHLEENKLLYQSKLVSIKIIPVRRLLLTC